MDETITPPTTIPPTPTNAVASTTPTSPVKATTLSGIMQIFKSASKIVFVAIALAVIAALFTGHITGDQFMILASMTFTFYFANKGEANKPYAGK